MKSYRYPIFAFVLLALALSITPEVNAQRYRHGYPRGHRGYYRPHYAPPRMYASSRPFISVNFGGVPYRYQYGTFYRPYGASFRFVMPPIGIRIATLPPGYRSMQVGPDPYYYYNGVYYRSSPNRDYEVVTPPLGAVVNELPPGAKLVVIDGNKFYELGGTYYEEQINDDDELEYRVVGTDGVIDTDGSAEPIPSGPQVGDRVDSLPQDARPVVIQGEKFYTTGSGHYYKEVVDGNKVYYEIVGR